MSYSKTWTTIYTLIIFVVILTMFEFFFSFKQEFQPPINAKIISNTKTTQIPKPTRNETTKNKTILYWDSFFDAKDMGLGFGHKIFENCPVKDCFATADKQFMPVDQFDAVVFHGARYKIKLNGIPSLRRPEQKYIFFSAESAFNTYFEKQVNKNFYNWTMTFRRDSDIHYPYAVIKKQQTNYTLPSVTSVKKRPKIVAWIVSNCHSKGTQRRIKYVRELRKYIPVDVYGHCGTLKCPDSKDCYKMLEDQYKFYLSFENTMCEDYVTEKLYNTLRLNLVPIVLSFVNYKALAPPNSVINVNDFMNPKHLAEYLLQLNENVTEYLNYFQWKHNFIVTDVKQYVLCQLCEKLHEDLTYSSYADVEDWYKGFSCVL